MLTMRIMTFLVVLSFELILHRVIDVSRGDSLYERITVLRLVLSQAGVNPVHRSENTSFRERMYFGPSGKTGQFSLKTTIEEGRGDWVSGFSQMVRSSKVAHSLLAFMA